MAIAPVVMCEKCLSVYGRERTACPSCGHRCEHAWKELTRHRSRYEPGRVQGTQRCLKCGIATTYQKDEDE